MPKAERAGPRLTVASFDHRCKQLASGFSAALEQERGQVAFAPDISGDVAVMSLAGRGSESARRNLGGSHRVVPLCSLNDGVAAWVGYREVWQRQSSGTNLRFRNAGFTVHLGLVGDVAKPQLLRSEWISRNDAGFDDRVGHPHWQLDVLESMRVRPAEPAIQFDEQIPDQASQNFVEAAPPPASVDPLLGLTIERMHLASAALWWRSPAQPIAHHVETVQDLDRWVLRCVAYLRRELGQCVVLPT